MDDDWSERGEGEEDDEDEGDKRRTKGGSFIVDGDDDSDDRTGLKQKKKNDNCKKRASPTTMAFQAINSSNSTCIPTSTLPLPRSVFSSTTTS
eukprot:m.126136 g.126136  ORF g.126136 m.126136 type:complete len:93 (-) comp12988_c8_seq4:995-1273(-)